LRSFRTTHLTELVRFGAAAATVKARVERGQLERVYEVRLEGGRKHVRLDGKTPRSLGDYFGEFNVVLFAPEDLRVPRGSPGGRRRFLDRTVFNRHPEFLGEAQGYQRVLKSRNQLLREGRHDEQLLAVYDEQLATLGARIVGRRRELLAELAPGYAAAWEAITRSGLTAALEYQGGAEDLAAEIAASRARDLARKQTSVGPHVHDVDFQLDGRSARSFASQGQLRALVLAWKTAEMRLLQQVHRDAPILLLDDVSSELDPARNRYLFDFLEETANQCFVTTTHPRHVLAAENRKDFQVVDGEVRT
jgi:DNA replication and repair protein RecF